MDSINRVMVKKTEGICFQFFLSTSIQDSLTKACRIEGKCQYPMYVKVIKPELIFDLPHRRTLKFLGKLLQKVVFTDEKGHVCKLTQNTDLVLGPATN